MTPIRLIAMDMDGTLLTRIDPETACMPAESVAALRRAADLGVHLALASGRQPDDASFYAHDAGLKMHIISLNGGMTLDAPFGVPTACHFHTEQTARRLVALLRDTPLDVAVFGAWEVVSLRERPDGWARRVLGTYYGRAGGRLTYRSGGAGLEALLPQVAKVVALADGEGQRQALEAAKARVLAEFPELSVTASWWDNFEVNPPYVDKGAALRELAAHLHIPMTQVMAIGDADNDVPMLRAAGIGVAMGNANEAARAAADVITLPNAEHGVAAAVRAIVLGEDVPGLRYL